MLGRQLRDLRCTYVLVLGVWLVTGYSWIEGFWTTLVAGFSHCEGMIVVGLELMFDRQQYKGKRGTEIKFCQKRRDRSLNFP